MDVFLSASVPLPDRDERYYTSADVVGIREAVKALAIETVRGGTLTFGGHPAITPLLALIVQQVFPNYVGRIILYQSEFFFKYFPKENNDFIDVQITPAVRNNRAESLLEMRRTMLTSRPYKAAFFIGGMEGVIEEYDLLRELQPDVPCYPIASTGGASLELFDRGGHSDKLMTDLTYPTLFRSLLMED